MQGSNDLRPLKINIEMEESIISQLEGHEISILGTVTIDAAVDGLRVPTVFQVMENLTREVILCSDFLKDIKAQINLEL